MSDLVALAGRACAFSSAASSLAAWPSACVELHLERPRIDLGEQVALVDELAFLEGHVHQLAVDAAAHRDGVERVTVPRPVR